MIRDECIRPKGCICEMGSDITMLAEIPNPGIRGEEV